MTEHYSHLKGRPRVFISYARSDGEQFARDLRLRLEAEGIPLWQDRIGMEGGRDWWLQIVEALNAVEFMVLVMTPAALQSQMVRREWRIARQQGVCVYPIKGSAGLDFASLPRWMRDVHWYDLDQEWTKFVNDLNTRCEQKRVPFMVEDLPADFVERPEEFEALISTLLDEKREEPIAITAALRGAGGYGKTTIARAICHDERIQEAFDDGILWVTLGENPGSLIGKVEDLIYILSRERPGFSGIDAAMARLAELVEDRDILLVIDDVWNSAHLRPFLHGGKRCARLITTRNEDVLPGGTQRVLVDAMNQKQALQLLSAGLTPGLGSLEEMNVLRQLVSRLGEWPLLLTLVNGALRERVSRGQPLTDALVAVNKTLQKRGLSAFDARDPQERHRAVTKTLGVSFDLLSANDHMRYRELALFPEDLDISLAAVQRLWGATGGLDDLDTEEVCERLYRFSLLLRYELATRTIRLHDVIRTYLQQDMGVANLTVLHGQFLDAYTCDRWANLSPQEPYLWDHLAEHLIGAGRREELIATVKDGRYLTMKIHLRGVYAVEADVSRALEQNSADSALQTLKRALARISHLLNRCKTQHEVARVLYSVLSPLHELSRTSVTLERELPRPLLTSWHILPQLRDTRLLRTLTGHTLPVVGCAVSPRGDYIVSASYDRTLKVWDAQTGVERLTLRGHAADVYACAVSPRGDYIVSASYDRTLKVWDAQTGVERLTLEGHTGAVFSCAVSPRGDYIVSASGDRTLKVWDAQTGVERLTLEGHTGAVYSCAVSPRGDYIVSASYDRTLKVWDAQTGVERLTLGGHTGAVNSCAVSPRGDYIVSASDDQTLKVWDAQTGVERFTLRGHTRKVSRCAVSPRGDYIVSDSDDQTLKVWDVQTGVERFTLRGHTNYVSSCAVSPQGDYIVSASGDRTLKVWDVQTGEKRLTLGSHIGWVRGCAASPSGDYIVSASDDKTLKVWDAQTGEERLTLRGHTDYVRGCAVSPQGAYIVSASDDQTLKVWDAQTGEERITLRGHTGYVYACAVSPKGDYIVSASEDKTLKVWSTQTGEEQLTLRGHTDYVRCCVVSPQGNYIISASEDKTLKVWDAQTGEERLTLRGHTRGVFSCVVSPRGEYIVSASEDETLKVWDAQSGVERLTLRGHNGNVRGCAVSQRGEYIVSASEDKTLKVWDAQTGICLDTLFVESSLFGCTFCPGSLHIVAVGELDVYFLRLLL